MFKISPPSFLNLGLGYNDFTCLLIVTEEVCWSVPITRWSLSNIKLSYFLDSMFAAIGFFFTFYLSVSISSRPAIEFCIDYCYLLILRLVPKEVFAMRGLSFFYSITSNIKLWLLLGSAYSDSLWKCFFTVSNSTGSSSNTLVICFSLW